MRISLKSMDIIIFAIEQKTTKGIKETMPAVILEDNTSNAERNSLASGCFSDSAEDARPIRTAANMICSIYDF